MCGVYGHEYGVERAYTNIGAAYVLNTPTSGREERAVKASSEYEGMQISEYSGMRSNAAEYVSCPLERWLGDKSTYSAASVSSRSTSDGSPSTEKA